MKDNLFQTAKDAVKYWWVSLIIGLLSLVLGVWCLLTPDSTLVALTMLFIISFLVGGVIEIIFAVANRKSMNGWGFSLAGGIIDVLFGILLLVLPLSVITLFLIYFVGFWIMFRSIWAVGISVELQQAGVRGWGWSLAMAILGIIFSFLFILNAAFGAGFIVAFASVAFITYGIFRIYLSIKIKTMGNDLRKVEETIEKVEDLLE